MKIATNGLIGTTKKKEIVRFFTLCDSVGIRAQNHILDLRLCPRTLNGPRKDTYLVDVSI